MPDIVIDTYALEQYAGRLADVNRRLVSLDGRLKNLYTKVGLLGLLDLIQADWLTGYSSRLLACQGYLLQAANDFENIEEWLQKQDPFHFDPPMRTPAFFPDSETPFGGRAGSYLKNLAALGLGGVTRGASEFYNFFFPQELVGEYKDKKYLGKKYHLEHKQDEKDIYQDGEEEKWYKKNGTVTEKKYEGKVESSLLEGKAEGEGEYGQYSAGVKVLTGEAHASAAAGLYVYEKDKNGNVTRVFSPGVSAEVGASTAAFEVDADGRIGLGEDNKMLGAYGDVDAKVLSAEGKAKISVNKNEIYAGASAEADLIKASATAGVSVLGTDIGVSGSLKVGIGAHAEVGFTDGKLKVDIGAAIGVGFDLGFEVDVKGTVNAVCDFAKSAWEKLKLW